MNKLVTLLSLLAISTAHASLTARDIKTVFIKNAGNTPAYIWIDKVYQGGVAPGETCWLSAAGVQVEEDLIGGWRPRNLLEIRIIGFESPTSMTLWSGPLKIFNSESLVTGGTGPHARVYVGGDASDAPSDWDVINSAQCAFVPAPPASADAEHLAQPSSGGSVTLDGELH